MPRAATDTWPGKNHSTDWPRTLHGERAPSGAIFFHLLLSRGRYLYSRGLWVFVDYSSTRGIQVDVGLPDATLENRAESPLYEELYPNTILVSTCIFLSQTVQYMQYIFYTATWAHKQYLIYISIMSPTIYPIVSRVTKLLLYNTY